MPFSISQPCQPAAVAFLPATVAIRPTTWLSRRSASQLSSPTTIHHRPTVTPCIQMSWKPAGLLQEAVEIKKMEVELMEDTLTERPDHPINMRRAFFAPKPSHRFSNALRRRDGSLSIVAAIKRFQAPKCGEKPEFLTPLEELPSDVRMMECNGADAALFYTDMLRYGVESQELAKASHHLKSSNVDLGMPIARQDLIIDPIQVAEAAELGACAVNVIAAAALPELMEILNSATAMGLEGIVECHTELERDFAMECGATILHLTNWDRTRNVLVPGTAEKLVGEVPPWVLTIGGGGLVTASDCWQLLDAGFNGVVLGKTLLQSRRPSGFMSEIRSQKKISGDVFSGSFGMPFSDEMDKA